MKLTNTFKGLKRLLRRLYEFIWRLKVELRARRIRTKNPQIGYYEALCLSHGYSEEDIDEMVMEALKDGYFASSGKKLREEVCESEVGYWE